MASPSVQGVSYPGAALLQPEQMGRPFARGLISTSTVGVVDFSTKLVFHFFTSSSVSVRQSLTVPSVVPDAKVLPSGENATDATSEACPLKVTCSLPVAAPRSFTVPSQLDEARVLVLGENTNDEMNVICLRAEEAGTGS
jgi:hypothetical protein